MTAVRAMFLFGVNGIWVRREALGKTFCTQRDAMSIKLTFPPNIEGDLGFEKPSDSDWDGAVDGPATGTADDPLRYLSVYRVKITVEFDANLDPTAVFAGDMDARERAAEHLQRADEVASTVFRELRSWLRSHFKQSWLGLNTEPIETEGVRSLFDVSSGKRFPVSAGNESVTILWPEEWALDPSTFSDFWQKIVNAEQAPIPETLLADAEHFAWGNYQAPDPIRAILMAAIACEVKVKTNLAERVHESQKEILAFILEHPREITLTAADSLFDKLMLATQGRSLRDEDKGLFKNVKRLFEVRNRVAHGGESRTAEEARDLVRAARQAFAWLDKAQ